MLNVSFIVPVYNSEKDLPRLLSSLTGQQGDYSFEILLIDDGSTDRSFEVCRRFADEDSRIRVFHQDNAGPSAARNKGLDMAGGEYILFCDADDYIETDSLQQLLSLPHHDLVFFSLYDEMWDAQHLLSSSAWKVESRAYSSTAALLNDFHYLLLHNLLYSQCTKLYCREIIEANHLRFETGISMGEDISFNLEYFAYVQSAYILNACLYHYVHVTRSQSISSGYYPGYYDNVCMVMQREKQLLSRFNVLTEENEEALQRYFLGRVSSAVQNDFARPKCHLRGKYRSVRTIFSSHPAQEAARCGHPTRHLYKILAFCIRHRWYLAGTFLFLAVSFTKLRLPRLVGRIKGE